MLLIRPLLFLLASALVLFLAACEDRTESKTKHRSLADAASELRSSAMVDTTWRGHVAWNGAAQILKTSDCYLLEQDYVMVGRGDSATLRVIFRAQRSGDMDSILFDEPRLVELSLDASRHEGATYRAEPPQPDTADISAEPTVTFGSVRLARSGPGSRRSAPSAVEVSFEFHCPG